MDGHIVGVRRIVDQREPSDDVALDGIGDVVDGVRAIGEAEVNDCGSPSGLIGIGAGVGEEGVGRCGRGLVRLFVIL